MFDYIVGNKPIVALEENVVLSFNQYSGSSQNKSFIDKLMISIQASLLTKSTCIQSNLLTQSGPKTLREDAYRIQNGAHQGHVLIIMIIQCYYEVPVYVLHFIDKTTSTVKELDKNLF